MVSVAELLHKADTGQIKNKQQIQQDEHLARLKASIATYTLKPASASTSASSQQQSNAKNFHKHIPVETPHTHQYRCTICKHELQRQPIIANNLPAQKH